MVGRVHPGRGLIVKAAIGWRVPDEDEVEGVDFVEHGETAYEFASRGGGRLATGPAAATASTQSDTEARGVNA